MNAMKQLQKLLLLLCLVTIGAQGAWADTTWNINIYNADNDFGEVSSNKSKASMGETVTLTLRPHTYSQLISARVTGATSGNNVPLTKNDNGTYSFQMPDEAVNVRVRFGQPAELVTDVMLIGSKGQDVTNKYKNQYMAEGWKFLNYDLNEDAGGAFIYLLYKSEYTCFDSNNNFVTDFYIKVSGSQGRPETITHNGRTYYPVPGGGGDAFIADNVQCDLNYDAGGDYVYLYYTKDPFEDGRAVCYIDFNDGSDGAVRANGGTSAADLNSGTAGVWLDHRAIYMHFTREYPPIAPEQAIWCSGNKTLYFVNNVAGQSYAQGDTYQGQTVTNVWSGTNVTDVGWGTPKWNAIAADVERVVFDKTFTWVRPKSLFKWFCFMNNLEEIEGLEYLNTSEVTNMNSMFYECYKLKTLDLNNFDVSKVTNATSMFQYATGLTTIYCDNVWNITTAAEMFAGTYCLVGAAKYSGSKTGCEMATPKGYFTSRTTLAANEDNTSLLTARDQYYGDVTIEGLKLKYDGSWNTLCLPFSINDFSSTPLNGFKVYSLNSADINNGTLTLNFTEVSSTEAGKPFIVKNTDFINIASNSDWNDFADAVNNGTLSGSQVVCLSADISISTTVGTEDNPFTGTFDGQGHTLNVNIGDINNQGTAPFRYIENANIVNVKTTGGVIGGTHCSGLVGFAKSGTNNIKNCEVSAIVTTWGSHCGGILGHGKASTTTITDCLFSGELNHAPSQTFGYNHSTVTAIGLIYGYGDDPGVHTIANCMVTGDHSGHANFNMLQKNGGTHSIINCYTSDQTIKQGTYTRATGNDLVAQLGSGWEVRNGKAVPKIFTEELDPVFKGVTISNVDNPITTAAVTFKGTYSPVEVTSDNKTIISLDGNNTLHYPTADMTIGTFRSYFQINTNLGDVNGDGKVNISDVVCMVNHILGSDNTNFVIENADMNRDGDINISDVTVLVNIILGNYAGTLNITDVDCGDLEPALEWGEKNEE